MTAVRGTLAVLLLLLPGCASRGAGNGSESSPTPSPFPSVTPTTTPTGTATPSPTSTPNAPLHLVVATFNTGAGSSVPSGSNNGGYSSALANAEGQYYGHGLAWPPAIESTRQFLADVAPDIVTFQEIFYAPDCAGIPQRRGPASTARRGSRAIRRWCRW